MEKIEFGKKYFLSCYDYKSEGIYLGLKRKPKFVNKHFFMVKHDFMKYEDLPVVIGCANFKIKEENKLEILSARLYFPNLSKQEEFYIKELSKKYW